MEALQSLLGEVASVDVLAALLAAHDGDVAEAAAAYFDQAAAAEEGASSVLPSSTSAAPWACAVCTLENPGSASACAVCDAPSSQSRAPAPSAGVADTASLERDISALRGALGGSELLVGLSEHEPTRGSKAQPRRMANAWIESRSKEHHISPQLRLRSPPAMTLVRW